MDGERGSETEGGGKWGFTPIGQSGKSSRSYRLKVGTVVGATDGWWSQVHHFCPTDEEKMAVRGEMVAVVSFRAVRATDVDIMAVGREILGRLNEEYFGVQEGSVWDQLCSAVERVYTEVSDREKAFGLAVGSAGRSEEAEIMVEQLDIAVGVLWRGVWYAVGAGSGGLWVWRDGGVGPILGKQESGGPQGDGFEWGGSGWVSDGDVFLLGTRRFFNLVGGGVIKAALSSGSADEAVGVLSPVVRGKEGNDGVAAAVVAVEQLPELRPVAEIAAVPRSQETLIGREAGKRGAFGFLVGLARRFPRPGRLGLGRTGLGPIGKGLYIRTYHPPGIGRRGTMALGIFLLTVILVSVILGVKIQKDRELVAGPVAQTEQRLSQARELASLSPERARQVLQEAKVVALTIKEAQKRKALMREIGDLSDQLLAVKRVVPTVFMDLRLVRDGLAVQDSAFDDKAWWGLDTSSQRLVRMGVVSKQAEVKASKDQVGNGVKVAALGDLAYVFGDRGIVEVSARGDRPRLVVGTDKDWGRVAAISNFGGNLYLLDTKEGMIWRYPAVEGGYGGKQRWFRETKVNLSGTTGMAIDGSIWVGTNDGLVLKFTQGVADSFVMPPLDEPIGNLAAIFTTADMQNLYLLDSGLGRVVVVSKRGDYVGQYIAGELKGATNVAADESLEKAILVTAGDKILEIKL